MRSAAPTRFFPLWKTIKVATLESAVGLAKVLASDEFRIGDWTADILEKVNLATAETEVELVQVSVRDLGFEQAATRKEIYDRATQEYSLELVSAGVGLQLRLQYQNQPMNEWLHLAMEPIADSNDRFLAFALVRYEDGPWLQTYYVPRADLRYPDDRFVFATARQPRCPEPAKDLAMDNHPFTLEALKEQSRWLMRHASDTYTVTGEDGILAKALELLPEPRRWCVEFGALDGVQLSNTFRLVSECEFRVVLIEANAIKYRDLVSDYPHPQRAVFLNARVGFSPDDGLDSLLSKTSIPADFDLLSIDIDGNDYHVWEAIKNYRPRLVLIEYNPTISNSVHFVQKAALDVNEGASALALTDLARRKGYELIADTGINLLFVTAEYFGRFHIPDNSLAVIRDDSCGPQIYVGFNGRIGLYHEGEHGLIVDQWHGLHLAAEKVQLLPACLRKLPGNYTKYHRLLYWLRFGRYPGELLPSSPYGIHLKSPAVRTNAQASNRR